MKDALIADPLDRLGAAVVDWAVVLTPVLTLVASPFRRAITESVLLDDRGQVFIGIALGSLAVAALALIYQIVSLRLFSATVGMAFFNLRVRDIWDAKSLTWSQSLLRALVWMTSLGLFGLPLLEVFSNSRRRALHDRISDCIVISRRKGAQSSVPQEWEVRAVRGVLFAIVALVFLALGHEVGRMVRVWRLSGEVSVSADADETCPEVDSALDSWIGATRAEVDRLDVAMALFAAGRIDRDCLGLEVDLEFRGGHETALAYLANSFVYAEKADLSDSYLEKVCQVDSNSTACRMSRVVDLWSQEAYSDVERELGLLEGATDVYVRIWAIRHHMRRENYEAVMKQLERIPKSPGLGTYLARTETKALWALNKPDTARSVASVLESFLSSEELVDLNSWICWQEIGKGCDGFKANSCRRIIESLQLEEDLAHQVPTAMIQLNQVSCQEEGARALAKMPGDKELADHEELYHLWPEDVQTLAEAHVLLLQKRSDEAVKILNELLRRRPKNDWVLSEAQRAVIRWTRQVEDLKEILTTWEARDRGLEWAKVGRELFERFSEFKKPEESHLVGRLLLPHLTEQDPFRRIVSLSQPAPPSERKPASQLKAKKRMDKKKPDKSKKRRVK